MPSKKVIKNYNIMGDEKTPATPAMTGSAHNIIKNASIAKENRKIQSSEDQDKKSTPKLNVIKDERGIITSLEITCACGEKIHIALDYE